MANCAAVGYTNHSKKNPNLSFDKLVMSCCKRLRGKNPFSRTSISVPNILEKTILKEI